MKNYSYTKRLNFLILVDDDNDGITLKLSTWSRSTEMVDIMRCILHTDIFSQMEGCKIKPEWFLFHIEECITVTKLQSSVENVTIQVIFFISRTSVIQVQINNFEILALFSKHIHLGTDGFHFKGNNSFFWNTEITRWKYICDKLPQK